MRRARHEWRNTVNVKLLKDAGIYWHSWHHATAMRPCKPALQATGSFPAISQAIRQATEISSWHIRQVHVFASIFSHVCSAHDCHPQHVENARRCCAPLPWSKRLHKTTPVDLEGSLAVEAFLRCAAVCTLNQSKLQNAPGMHSQGH